MALPYGWATDRRPFSGRVTLTEHERFVDRGIERLPLRIRGFDVVDTSRIVAAVIPPAMVACEFTGWSKGMLSGPLTSTYSIPSAHTPKSTSISA